VTRRSVRWLPWFVTCCALVLAGCGAGVLPPVHSEGERLDIARHMIAQRDYTRAIELLKTYIQNNAGSANVDAAIELLGESYLKTRDYASAQVEFERLLRDYPESDSSGSAAFRLGEALYGQARGPDFDQDYTVKALDQWQSYVRAYPGHWLQPEAARRVAQARQRLASKLLKDANLYLKLRLGGPAEAYFQRVIDEFPDTPQASEASIGVALAEAAAGHKPRAIERLKQLETQYPGQPIAARAARERARLER